MGKNKPALAGIFKNIFAPPLVAPFQDERVPREEGAPSAFELAGELVTNYLTKDPPPQHQQQKLWHEFELLLGQMDPHQRGNAVVYTHLSIQESAKHRYGPFPDNVAEMFRMIKREPAPPLTPSFVQVATKPNQNEPS